MTNPSITRAGVFSPSVSAGELRAQDCHPNESTSVIPVNAAGFHWDYAVMIRMMAPASGHNLSTRETR